MSDFANAFYHLHHGDVCEVYDAWPEPDLIISDGAYGISGFRGDAKNYAELPQWYEPHLKEWQAKAKRSTSLWFWNTEVGWATIHPLLIASGWEYVQLVVWDKGLAHVAGNSNGETLRQLPVVTEVAALYRRKPVFCDVTGKLCAAQEWLRAEWLRSGLPLSKANEACGVKNAATRKYLTADYMWYWPLGEAVARMACYCEQYGAPSSQPYFSLDGINPITAELWDAQRATWHHKNGMTNVWARPPLASNERFRGRLTSRSAAHLNQKPLDLMINQIAATTDRKQVVWEPFGGLASASVASVMLGRYAYVAEVDENFVSVAKLRLDEASASLSASGALDLV